MNVKFPAKPIGSGPELTFMRRVCEALSTQNEFRGEGVNQTTSGVTITPKREATTPFKIRVFFLRDVAGDYLVGREFNGWDEEGVPQRGDFDFYIAKEPKHRESLTDETILGEAHAYTYADGPSETWAVGTKATFNRVRTDGTEDQRIVPPWTEDEIIYAMEVPDTYVRTVAAEDGDPTYRVTLLIMGRSTMWMKKRAE